MIVFKFGGASVKNAAAIKNMANIIAEQKEQLIIVISAMGKTTNRLEEIIDAYVSSKQDLQQEKVQALADFHLDIATELFENPRHKVFEDISLLIKDLQRVLQKTPSLNFDHDYDQIICFGELLSTKIVSHFLDTQGMRVLWKDVRLAIKTNNSYREARVNWEITKQLVPQHFAFDNSRIIVTQGFLGSTPDNITTTLGREGSDYTGAVLAYVLKANHLVIWKDVPGVLNADPKWFDDTVLLPELSYRDAIELAYYGASVIHPKTIKPLQNKNINLYVKSFVHPREKGTVISNINYEKLVPSFIFKMDQVLIRIQPKDFSFIAEDHLQTIFGILSANRVKINLMQNSALKFLLCINNDKRKLPAIIEQFENEFKVSYETGLELITIRYFDQSTIDRVTLNKELILEHRDQKNVQLIVRDMG